MGTDSQTESRGQLPLGVGRGIEKKEKGLMVLGSSVVIALGEGPRGVHGSGKNTITKQKEKHLVSSHQLLQHPSPT